MLHKSLESVRRFNREGIQGALTDIDEKFMQPFFVAKSNDGSPTAADRQTHGRQPSDMSDRAAATQGDRTPAAHGSPLHGGVVGAAHAPLRSSPQQLRPLQGGVQQLRPPSLQDDDGPPTPPYLRSVTGGGPFEVLFAFAAVHIDRPRSRNDCQKIQHNFMLPRSF